jgi:hypothetical protein
MTLVSWNIPGGQTGEHRDQTGPHSHWAGDRQPKKQDDQEQRWLRSRGRFDLHPGVEQKLISELQRLLPQRGKPSCTSLV